MATRDAIDVDAAPRGLTLLERRALREVAQLRAELRRRDEDESRGLPRLEAALRAISMLASDDEVLEAAGWQARETLKRIEGLADAALTGTGSR